MSTVDDATRSRFEAHRAAARERLSGAGVGRSGPDSISWMLNREIVVVASWGRAILLQLAHPLVAQGVAEHSSFRSGHLTPLHRLFSTVGAMLALTFGDDEEAIASAAGINLIHDRVFGHLETDAGRHAAGTPYTAHDPHLLRWVHATLLDSVPLFYDLLVRPLTAEERDRYCAETAIMEPLLGIPSGFLPRTAADVEALIRDAIEGRTVAVSDTARELARAVLWPRGSVLLWPVFRPLRLLTIGLLPPAVREGYGFRWTARESRALRRWIRAIHLLRALTPSPLRTWPVAQRASRRHDGLHRQSRPASSSA